jgi:hypothetical protein
MEASATQTIANLGAALAPGFAAGFAVQQALQIIDPVVEGREFSANKKKAIMGFLSLILGLLIAWLAKLQILATLWTAADSNRKFDGSAALDIFVSALIISAGTEGLTPS